MSNSNNISTENDTEYDYRSKAFALNGKDELEYEAVEIMQKTRDFYLGNSDMKHCGRCNRYLPLTNFPTNMYRGEKKTW